MKRYRKIGYSDIMEIDVFTFENDSQKYDTRERKKERFRKVNTS